MSGNLLQREVTAEDVAEAFLHQALELKTTANITTVDGGNIAAALRQPALFSQRAFIHPASIPKRSRHNGANLCPGRCSRFCRDRSDASVAVTSEEKKETCKVGAESQQLQGAKRDAFIKKCMAGGNYEPPARKRQGRTEAAVAQIRGGPRRRPFERCHLEATQDTSPQNVNGDRSPDPIAIEQSDQVIHSGHGDAVGAHDGVESSSARPRPPVLVAQAP